MSGAFFVRWKPGEPREGRVFDPLPTDDPAAALPCLVCENVLGDGRPVQLYAVGWHDEESRERHAEGRWYSAQAELLHAACMASMPPAFAEQLTAEPGLLLAPVEPTPEQVEEFKAQPEAVINNPPKGSPRLSVTRAQVREAAHALFVWNNELDGEPRFVLNDVTQGVDREPYGALVDEVLHHLGIPVREGNGS